MVRLVFRPYTQVRPSICTSERLRASTRISPGFALLRYSSPSFGSHHVRSRWQNDSDTFCRQCCIKRFTLLVSLRLRVCHSKTRSHDGLLGPCFKTGRSRPQHAHNKAVMLHYGVVQTKACTRLPIASTTTLLRTLQALLLGSPSDSPFTLPTPQPRSLPF